MKLISLFLTYLLFINTALAGLPPTTLSGQTSATKTTTFNFKVPHKQATRVTGGTLISDCGSSNNLLENCSFEHATIGSSWVTSVTSTAVATIGEAASSSNELGLKHGTFSCAGGASGGVCTFYQDVTTAKTIQGLVSVFVSSSSTTGVKVKSRVNAVNNLEVSVSQLAEALYKIPQILGSTNTGVAIEVTVAASTTITGTMDHAFVGAVDLKQDINVVGPWISYTPTFVGFGTPTGVNCKHRQVGPNREIDCYFISGASTAVVATVSMPSGDVASTNVTSTSKVGAWSQSVSLSGNGHVLADASSSTLFFGYETGTTAGLTKANGNGIIASGTSMSFQASIPIVSLTGSTSVYSSTNADTGWSDCGIAGSSLVGFGSAVPTTSLQCKRQGEDLLMKGKFTAGTTPTAVEARIPLPVWNGVQLTSAGVTKIPSVQATGEFYRGTSTTSNIGSMLMEPSVTYITFGGTAQVSDTLIKRTGNSVLLSGEPASITARVPISGWENSNVTIGSFTEVMTTPGVSKPKTCYYAFGGASATLASPTVCSTGTCVEIIDSCGAATPPAFSATGNYVNATFAAGTFANSSSVQCSCVSYDTTSTNVNECVPYFVTGKQTWSADSSGGFVGNLFSTTVGGVGRNGYVQFKCEGQAP